MKRRSTTRAGTVESLLAAALAISGGPAAAQTAPDHEAEIRVQYGWYQDYQGPREDRMEVQAPSFSFHAPVAGNAEIEGGFVYDSMSGASPLYLDTLSGASGLGIKDERYAADLKYTKYFERFSVGAGVVGSTEDDYDSLGGMVTTSYWSDDRNTTYSFGFSGNGDSITSTNYPELDEHRTSYSFLLGITQILDPLSQIQTNVTYSTGDGYFSDPYKALDSRPHSREAFAWVLRYVRAILSTGGTLHADYRLYLDSWGIDSNMLELSYRQPIGRGWSVQPLLRYYTQGSARFFSTTYPPEGDGFYTPDHRLSGFGGISTGIKLAKDLGGGYSIDLAYEHIYQDGDLKLGGGGTKGLAGFGADLVTTGVSKRF